MPENGTSQHAQRAQANFDKIAAPLQIIFKNALASNIVRITSMDNPHMWGRAARSAPADFRQAWNAALQIHYARTAYFIQGKTIRFLWGVLVVLMAVIWASLSSVQHKSNPALVTGVAIQPPSAPVAMLAEGSPVSRDFLERLWTQFPADQQLERIKQMNWDPAASDKSVFAKAESNVFELRRHWKQLSQIQKDSIVTFCHVYPYCR